MLGQPLFSLSTLPPPDTPPTCSKTTLWSTPCTRDLLQARLGAPSIWLGEMGLSQSGVAHAVGSAAVTFSLTSCWPAGARIFTLVTKSLPSAHLCHTSPTPSALHLTAFSLIFSPDKNAEGAGPSAEVPSV